MASPEQIKANRLNARRSTGPKNTDRTRFNALKHGLRSEEVVIPGESREEFDEELRGWLDEWRPASRTRAALVERAMAASWRARRAARAEGARQYETGAAVAEAFDEERRVYLEVSLRMLASEPGAAVARLACNAEGLDALIGLWDALAEAAAPGRWSSRTDHHDRLLNLLGHRAGSEPPGLEPARDSLALLGGDAPAAAPLRAFCLGRAAELRAERAHFWDPAVQRRRAVDAACAPVGKEAQLIHRYEMAHEKSMYSALRMLHSLEKSGADLHDEPEPEPRRDPFPGPEAASAGPDVRENSYLKSENETTCSELASLGAAAPRGGRPRRPAAPPRRADGPIGVDPGPGRVPRRA